MDFSICLKQRRERRKISSAKDHYESLGGNKVLKITLRHFREIENGNHHPPPHVFSILFKTAFSYEKKDLIISYFNSLIGEKEGSEIVSYIEESLNTPLVSENKSVWDTKRLHITYSNEQLDYLTKNEKALLFHKRLLLYDNQAPSVDSCELSMEIVNKLIALDLAEIKKGKIYPSRSLYRVPRFENSPPKTVGKATDYILKHIDTFISKEGSSEQDLSFNFQLINPDHANQVLEQIRVLKNWIQSLATQDESPPNRPLVFVSFCKLLSKKDFGVQNEGK